MMMFGTIKNVFLAQISTNARAQTATHATPTQYVTIQMAVSPAHVVKATLAQGEFANVGCGGRK